MKKNYKKVLSFVLICLMICTPFVSKYIVEAENDGTIKWMTYENYLVSEVKFMSEHPEYYIGSLAKFNDNGNVWNNFEIGRLNEARMDITANISPDDIFIGDISIHDHAPIRIVDYKLDSGGNLWFKIEEVEGYPINDLLKENPYVWTNYPYNENYPTAMYKDPSLFILPEKGMIADSAGYITLKLEKDTDMATKSIMIPKALMPDFVNVNYVGKDANQVAWYEVDTSFITDELLSQIIVNVPSGIDPLDCIYIEESSVTIIPSLVSRYYEELINAQTKTEYDEIYNSIPESVLDQFSKVHLDKMEEVSSNLQIDEVYNQLLGATTTDEYYEVLESIDEDLLAKVEEKYKTELENHLNELIRLDNIEYEQKVLINGVEVPVKVKGRIPENILTFSVTAVSNSTVVNEGFDIENATDIIAALDIKFINKDDGTEWQPDSKQRLRLSIGVGALGIADGTIVRLDHKHDGEITVYDEMIVIDGALSFYIDGFSIFVVQTVGSDSTTGQRFDNNATINLEIGDRVIYYSNQVRNTGTWEVEDTSGAIHYIVHTQGAPGHAGVYAPWIEIICLKESTTPVKLIYRYADLTEANGSTTASNSGSEQFSINVKVPTARSGRKELFIKDDVNKTGRIIVGLANDKGAEITADLAGAAFTWERSDEIFITPRAYGDNRMSEDQKTVVANSSVNIAMDHSGLVERRKNGNDYDLITYTVHAKLADGTELEADYTVYYQSEFINADFEEPSAAKDNYTFFVNGMKGLYWKTTAPGAIIDANGNVNYNNLSKDVEIGQVESFWDGEGRPPNDANAGTKFGVARAADFANGGVQFAELNAEAFGALYQDIISVPKEFIEWKFCHAPRRDQTEGANDWATNISNRMFIIIGATEDAQKLTTQGHLEELGQKAKTIADGNQAFLSGQTPVTVDFTYSKDGKNYGTYQVWYHDSTTIGSNGDLTNGLYQADGVYGKNNNYGWTELSGSYETPDNQFRTRLFFVSEKSSNPSTLRSGNLIDNAWGGIYKSYTIEYYEESFDKTDNSRVITKHLSYVENGDIKVYDQSGVELIYSSVPLTGLSNIEFGTHDYLHRIVINGKVYPYEIRTSNDQNGTIFIENYQGTKSYVNFDEGPEITTDYNEVDIVVQIFVRDTVIAIEKDLIFPEALTTEQKLKIIEDLTKTSEGGYKTTFSIADTTDTYKQNVDVMIKSRNPDGSYSGYIAPDNNPSLDVNYVVSETYSTPLVGLELAKVEVNVTRYRYGNGAGFESDDEDRTNNMVYPTPPTSASDPVNKLGPPPYPSDYIYLSERHATDPEQRGYKIAEVTVKNTYVEKLTTIKYRAIGNGKLKFVPENIDPSTKPFMDEPSETLPFYSGKATGCLVYPRSDATFKGWYRIANSTDPVGDIIYKEVDGVILELAPVTSADGVWDGQRFKPNSNIINSDEVTFYAVFETKSIRIEKTNGIPNQTYFYKVTGDNGLDVQVALKCNSEGYGFVDMYEVGATTVTVNEIVPWSWRDWETSNNEIKGEFEGKNTLLTFNFDRTEPIKDLWLNGYSELVENIFGKLKLGGGQ